MVLLTLAQISKQFEHKVILDSINCTIREGERVAIIGQNGSGKSTLINILGGELEADSGERMPRQGLQILTLSQSQRFDPNISVYEVCEQSLSDLRHAHKRLSELERELILSQDKMLLEEQAEWIDFITQRLSLENLAKLNLPDKINDILGDALNQVLDTLTGTVPHLISATSSLVSAVVTTVISFVFSVYMLSGGPKLTAQCRRLVVVYLPESIAKRVLAVVRLTADTFTKYVSGQLIEACILGSLCFIGMVVFRFDYAPLISVIIGVSALIPVAGAYIGAVLAALLLAMISPIKAFWFLVFLAVLQQLEGNLIYPRVVGTSLGLPGIWVLAAVTVGSSLLGFIGLVISVPLTAVVYTILKYDLRQRLPGKELQEVEDPQESGEA